jgi:hypothetical protein
MKSLLNTCHWSLLVCLTVASCGRGDKRKSGDPAPTVSITGVSATADGAQLLNYQSDQAGVEFECKVEATNQVGQWQSCPASGLRIDSSSGTVLVSVRAKRGALISAAETKFIAAAAQPSPSPEPRKTPQAIINEKSNAAQLAQSEQEIQISFKVDGLLESEVRYECQVGSTEFSACTSPLKLTRRETGEFPTVTVRPVVIATGEVGIADTIVFDQAVGERRQVPTEMLIGSQYKFKVPAGMHVSEFASNQNANSIIDAYRVRTESNPYYFGNTRCSGEFDSDFVAMSPSGQAMKYCNFTPTESIYKWMTDARWAFNHLAVNTDASLIDQNPMQNESIIMNIFEGNPEMRREHTKFWDLCRNAVGGELKVVPAITMMWNFWGERVRANFWMCTAALNTRQPSGLPTLAHYRVGAFFITDADLGTAPVMGLPDMGCSNCQWRYPHLLEVVYVSRANDSNVTPGIFAQTAQFKFGQQLMPINY